MVNKRSGELKTHRVANGRFKRVHADKSECSSPTPDLCYFKHVCGAIEKEKIDVTSVQTEEKDEDLLLLKLTGAVALLLVESDKKNAGSIYSKRMGSG